MEFEHLNITFAGTAHPYRGGIASFNEMLARTLISMGHNVKIETFTVQYPSILFPGKSQYTDAPAPKDLDITRSINSVNPFNWIKVGLRIKKERPDMLFLRYWTPYLAPALGVIARIVKSNRYTKVITLADNITPHERKVWDRPLTKFFINSSDAFVCMAKEVERDLRTYTHKPIGISPHPLYNNYGDKVDRKSAAEYLKLDEKTRYALFFGLIRKYKGLDILLDSWALFKKRDASDTKLIVAGEFYTAPEPYREQIKKLRIEDSVIIMDRFISDDEVKYLFSISDMIVQPYKSATQSGVTQIAYHFDTPMIVTRVGGLSEIVINNKTGFVTDVDMEDVSVAIEKLFDTDIQTEFKSNISSYKSFFSWEKMCETIINQLNR